MKKFLFLTIAAFAFVFSYGVAAAATDNCVVDITATVNETIDLVCSNATLALGSITPGTSIVGSTTCDVTTNANAGYDLSVVENDPLTHDIDGNTTIDEVSMGNVTTPAAWTEDTTLGLGFSVYASEATKNNTQWGSATECTTGAANLYAAFPDDDSVIMDHDSYSADATMTSICYKLDVPSTQKSGAYTGQVTYTATSKP